MASKIAAWIKAHNEAERSRPELKLKTVLSTAPEESVYVNTSGHFVIPNTMVNQEQARRLAEWILEITRDDDIKE